MAEQVALGAKRRGEQILKERWSLRSIDRRYAERINFPVLDKRQQIELARLIENGTEAEQKQARQKLVECNLRLVVFLAKFAHQFSCQYIPLMDLISEGNLMLEELVNRIGRHPNGYDWRRGIKFSTYAVKPIRFRLKDLSVKRRRYFNLIQRYANLLAETDTAGGNSSKLTKDDPATVMADAEERAYQLKLIEEAAADIISADPSLEWHKNILWRHLGLNGQSPKTYVELSDDGDNKVAPSTLQWLAGKFARAIKDHPKIERYLNQC